MSSVLEFVVFPLIVGAFSFPLLPRLLEEFTRERDKWISPKFEELRSLISDENVPAPLRDLSKNRYIAEAFFILTGIKPKNANELEALIEFERAIESEFSWRTLRTIYPMHLLPSNGNLSVRITAGQTLGHRMLYLVAIMTTVSSGATLYSVIDKGSVFGIAMATIAPIQIGILLGLQYLDTPYRNAKSVQKYIKAKSSGAQRSCIASDATWATGDQK
ncbi:membrane hypothetical protein [Agrobacterium fabrum str. J-07]|uniref:hypothetical protein n=1 Tax=Agrobacterium fabrum TaxID=1176649 RepID=UPI0009BB2E0A|nr:hypothetical protein [Agrobacterium fabrum]CUX56811.1 membrane hypothetical protein [Agrobacterium fabrum str. J-07]